MIPLNKAPTVARLKVSRIIGIIGLVCALPSPVGVHKGLGTRVLRPLSHSKVTDSMATGRTPPPRHCKWAREGWPARPPF